MADLLLNLDAVLCRQLLLETLPKLSLLDPACGSGAFLVAALKTLINIYSAVVGRIEFLNDPTLRGWLEAARRDHPSLSYYIKKRIITDNLYGVDLMEEATDIAKLRLFLALVASADRVEQLEPLPNIDFNILPGNSLLGLTRVDPTEFDKRGSDGAVQTAIFGSPYQQTVDDVNRRIAVYKQNDLYAENLTQAREDIRTLKRRANDTLDGLLLDRFKAQKIPYEAATWDDAKNKEGKPQKRPLTLTDVQALSPFHWGFEFHKVLQERGGFDAIITNPPWDVFEAHEKEFFQGYVPDIQKNKLRIEDWQAQQADLMKQPILRDAWLKYASRYPHVAKYFKTSPQYKNQISIVNGRNVGSKINLYTYFTEQCYNLLRDGGQCGIVIPSGIYTDLGAKQLREMLFKETRVTGLFGFENRKEIFEGVHRSFKFVVLTFTKGGHTEAFPAAFMRLETRDLELFPEQLGLSISVELIQRLSPDSLSVMEFKNEQDVQIAEKMAGFPLLGEKLEGTWNVELQAKFNMTTRAYLFKPVRKEGYLPLYEGKMMHQFNHLFEAPRYWLDEIESRKAVLGKTLDRNQTLDYQMYRAGFRKIARNTDTRTLISTIIPPNFHAESFHSVQFFDDDGNELHSLDTLVYLCALWNSFVVDWALRQKVSANVNMFYVYQLPIPRLTSSSPAFSPIVTRAAKLICTTGEFDHLAAEVGLGSSANGVTDPDERAALRAELDALVAHLYGLTETEFAYILTTFPLVSEGTKTAALAAYSRFAPTSDDTDILALIRQGEGAGLEFKSTARVNLHTNAPDKKMEEVILKTVAGFWNAGGGTLLVGVADDGTVLGLGADLLTLKKKDLDGFELFLTDLLLASRLGLSGLLGVTFHPVGGKTVCKVSVEAAPEPVWVSVGGAERFFVRTGNSTRELSGGEAWGYAKRRWG